MNIDLKNYGYQPERNQTSSQDVPARITAVHKGRYAIVCEYGETYAQLKTGPYYGGIEAFPTTGDFVLVQYISNGDSQILATLPRRTYFSRRDPDKGRGEQAVAANFDYVFLLQSMNQDFNVKRLERYLTLSWQSGATPVVVLTKADLAEDPDHYVRLAARTAAGASVHAVSARTGEGLALLRPYLQPGKTVALLGSSGVGKSTLVNALAGQEVMAVGGIREDDGKGRHTTTHRQLLMLPRGGMVIDTPGMRELGMWEASEGLVEAFSDVEQYLGRCRFRDCRHETEPGCAIRAAIDSGELDEGRWKRYQTLQRESQYAELRADALRQKQQWSKNIAKHQKRKKKEIW